MNIPSDPTIRHDPEVRSTFRRAGRLIHLMRETSELARFVGEALRAARERRRLQREPAPPGAHAVATGRAHPQGHRAAPQ